MIVETKQNELMLFTGNNYIQIPDEYLDGTLIDGKNIIDNKYMIDTFICIIQFSKPSYTIAGKKDMVRKESISLIYKSFKILTKTKKISQYNDIYAIVKIEKVQGDIIYCDVISYLDNIDDKFMEYACTAQWTRNKKITQQFLKTKDIDLTPDREDLTSLIVYSIDPHGCKDIDDALHYQYDKNTDEHEIGIHIADVTSYIEKDGELDCELKRRIETIYDYKKHPIHMIPEELSIEYMSLLEGVNKRAFSIIIKMNNKYDIISVEFKKTMINVTKNLSYEQAQNMVESNNIIFNLFDIGKAMKINVSGAFPIDEIYDTHQMVAIFMIYANKLTAEKIKTVSENNVLLRTNNDSNFVSQHNISESLIYNKYIINHKEKAKYQIGIVNSYHHSLNIDFYTHMTSPIRRYADIIIHRQLYDAINKKEIQTPNISDVFLMNYFKSYYRQINRIARIIEISKILKLNCYETDAYITMINDDKLSIRIYISEFNLDHDIILVHPKLKNIKKAQFINNAIIIKNYENNDELKYELFQKIKIKIISSKSSFVKLKVEIIE
jgi:exoribonuclease R